MAIFKCKICGGDLNIQEGATICVCEYCETKQTIPALDNEKKLNLFNRANRLRLNSEFDKAASIYESIIAEFPEEAEGYWGLVLCNYGIEYVDDPTTARKIPTCHRAAFESVTKDENYKLALEYADVVSQKVYRDEAREIDRIMSEILNISKNEEPYDIFICYKETDETGNRTIDSVIAQDVYDALTDKGYRVFFSRISLEDKIGTQYEPYIFAALNSAKVMLAFGTKYEYFHAVWVKNEWSRFLKLMAKDKSKALVPCYKDIDPYDMPDEFKALQAQDMGKVGAIQDLLRGIEKLLSKKETVSVKEAAGVNLNNTQIEPLLKRAFMFLDDEEWQSADEYCEKVLDIDPENAQAYLAKLMVDLKIKNESDFENCAIGFDENKYCKKALAFGGEDIKNLINGSIVRVKKRIAEMEAATKAELEAVSKKRIANARQHFVSVGDNFVVGLKSNGTVICIGFEAYGQDEILSWVDIVGVSAGSQHIVGLKMDGTVVASGNNDYLQCAVSKWKNIIAVSAGDSHTVGLKSDGTVVAVGNNEYGQCNVSGWTNIVAVSASGFCTLGLKLDGSVVAVGRNVYGECNVSEWTDIVAISAGENHMVGLKSDGTVVAVGNNDDGQCNVSEWTDIIAISTSHYHTVGVKSDRNVVAVGYNNDARCNVTEWNGIVSVSTGLRYSIGVTENGEIVATGFNLDYTKKLTEWKLFENINNFEEERKNARELLAAEKRRQVLLRSQGLCQYCGGTFKGFFTQKCSLCGRPKDY